MARTPDELENLLARVRAGDTAALGELVQQYEPRVRLAARMLLGPALRAHLDSIDITQSVHRTLLLGMRQEQFSFQTPQQLMALILTIVRRKEARQWRRLQRQQSNIDPAVEAEWSQLEAR
ncbi:MAG: ECF-type sigma factor, partial [Gemmataceae bacterium]